MVPNDGNLLGLRPLQLIGPGICYKDTPSIRRVSQREHGVKMSEWNSSNTDPCRRYHFQLASAWDRLRCERFPSPIDDLPLCLHNAMYPLMLSCVLWVFFSSDLVDTIYSFQQYEYCCATNDYGKLGSLYAREEKLFFIRFAQVYSNGLSNG